MSSPSLSCVEVAVKEVDIREAHVLDDAFTLLDRQHLRRFKDGRLARRFNPKCLLWRRFGHKVEYVIAHQRSRHSCEIDEFDALGRQPYGVSCVGLLEVLDRFIAEIFAPMLACLAANVCGPDVDEAGRKARERHGVDQPAACARKGGR
eukprot:6188273-Pleurochrysis_carterae.AAC.2